MTSPNLPHTTDTADAADVPEGVTLTSGIAILNATAMALGARRTNIEQTTQQTYSHLNPSDRIVTTRTVIVFDFTDPAPSRLPFSERPPGLSLEEAIHELAYGRLPVSRTVPASSHSSPSSTRAVNSPAPSVITIRTHSTGSESERGISVPEGCTVLTEMPSSTGALDSPALPVNAAPEAAASEREVSVSDESITLSEVPVLDQNV